MFRYSEEYTRVSLNSYSQDEMAGIAETMLLLECILLRQYEGTVLFTASMAIVLLAVIVISGHVRGSGHSNTVVR